ncbi:MAG: FMN-binding glutamate synthase family protein [Candidatus Aminicenantia bacterium]
MMFTKTASSRFRQPLAKFKVVRKNSCIACTTCVRVCPQGVHKRLPGYNRMNLPENHKCLGFFCSQKKSSCVAKCSRNALSVILNPQHLALGDMRWTPDMLLAFYQMAETGSLPDLDVEYNRGNSEGGFDRIEFNYPPSSNPKPVSEDSVDTSIELNKKSTGVKISIPLPIYGGGMSYGSISLSTMLARAMAAKELNTFTSTGEGGYPDELIPFADHIITQVATGLFGVREETIKRARIVEFKYAQGAKPGLGGHLLADKVTPNVAKMRQSVPWRSLFSPFPFHSVYSVEDHKKHIDWIKSINPEALISVKVSTPSDVDMVAVGSYYAGANIIHIDGGYGGTGAAPEIAKKNIAMPIEYAIPKTHEFLVREGIRDEITLMASGGIRTAHDIVKAIALGADGVVLGTAELVALECVRCGNCESGRGCPRGIATTDPELERIISPEWGAPRIVNLYRVYEKELISLLKRLGLRSTKDLRGRTEFLRYV